MIGLATGGFDDVMRNMRNLQKQAPVSLADGSSVGAVPKTNPAVVSDKNFNERQYALDQLFGDLRTNKRAIQQVIPQFETDDQAEDAAYLAEMQNR